MFQGEKLTHTSGTLVTKTNLKSWLYCISEEKTTKEEQTDADSDDSSEEFRFLEKSVHEFFHELKHYDMSSWQVDSVYKLVSSLTDLHVKEFDDFNIALSMILGETIRHWRTESCHTAELFLRLSMNMNIFERIVFFF